MQVYGQSECGPMILRYHRLENLGTVSGRDMGIGLEGYTEARITDAQGNPLPAGENGHIQFLSKGHAVTYYKGYARFQDNVYGAWWDSGDYGCMTPEGTLLLKDRQVDLIEHMQFMKPLMHIYETNHGFPLLSAACHACLACWRGTVRAARGC